MVDVLKERSVVEAIIVTPLVIKSVLCPNGLMFGVSGVSID